MIKLLPILFLCNACFIKTSITSFKEQLEYPGIESGTTMANYTIKIENTSENDIEVEGIWVRGRWIQFTQKSFSGNPIIIKASVRYIPPDSSKDVIKSPTRNNKDEGAIKYRVKGKKKLIFIGTESITREKPLARP
tara:strand:- start:184 stop:591 length:408 start_codon:yes stop_codon:yes gene_type:complete